MDRQLIEEKLESLRRCIQRVEDKCPDTLDQLELDLDAQDIVSLNLTRAVQITVDIAAHMISASPLSAPRTMGEAFEVLKRMEVIDDALCERLKGAVGFRNIAVHAYGDVSWQVVFSICKQNLGDFKVFAQSTIRFLES